MPVQFQHKKYFAYFIAVELLLVLMQAREYLVLPAGAVTQFHLCCNSIPSTALYKMPGRMAFISAAGPQAFNYVLSFLSDGQPLFGMPRERWTQPVRKQLVPKVMPVVCRIYEYKS